MPAGNPAGYLPRANRKKRPTQPTPENPGLSKIRYGLGPHGPSSSSQKGRAIQKGLAGAQRDALNKAREQAIRKMPKGLKPSKSAPGSNLSKARAAMYRPDTGKRKRGGGVYLPRPTGPLVGPYRKRRA